MSNRTPKAVMDDINKAKLEISTQSLQVLYQCAAQVPAKSGQQASLLSTALLEIEAILEERNAPATAPAAVE